MNKQNAMLESSKREKGIIYWYSKLLSLEIPAKLIYAADVNEQAYKELYKKLSPLVSQLNFRIKEAWQLKALSGDIDFYKESGLQEDMWGANLAHYAAWSGNQAALEWICGQRPNLLATKHNLGLTLVDYAAWSGKPEQLNYCLGLSENFSELTLSKNLLCGSSSVEDLFSNLSSALDNNYLLTLVKVDETANNELSQTIYPETLSQQIHEKLLRNSKIRTDLTDFKKCFLQGPKPYPTDKLNTKSLKQILRLQLNSEISETGLSQLYVKVKEEANAETAKLSLQKQKLNELITKECQRLETANNHWSQRLGFIESSSKKVNALKTLTRLIASSQDKQAVSLEEKIAKWQEENRLLIDCQRNKIDAFFRPHHQTSTRKLMENINSLLR